MPGGRQIVILTHARQGLGGHAMLERLWREHWQPAGLSVQVQQGLAKPPPADLALLHVDLTVTPPEYLTLADRYPRCLNRAVTDISKRRISQRRVPPNFDVPPALRRRRAELGFDFGKFDYVVQDGEPVLLDANRTPAIDEIGGERARLLAPGIHDFLPGRV